MTKQFVLEQGSGRSTKNAFATEDEANARALECAKILNRPIKVFELDLALPPEENKTPNGSSMYTKYSLVFPDGSILKGKKLEKYLKEEDDTGDRSRWPLVLGSMEHIVAALDQVAGELFARKAPTNLVDKVAQALTDVKASSLAGDVDPKDMKEKPATTPNPKPNEIKQFEFKKVKLDKPNPLNPKSIGRVYASGDHTVTVTAVTADHVSFKGTFTEGVSTLSTAKFDRFLAQGDFLEQSTSIGNDEVEKTPKVEPLEVSEEESKHEETETAEEEMEEMEEMEEQEEEHEASESEEEEEEHEGSESVECVEVTEVPEEFKTLFDLCMKLLGGEVELAEVLSSAVVAGKSTLSSMKSFMHYDLPDTWLSQAKALHKEDLLRASAATANFRAEAPDHVKLAVSKAIMEAAKLGVKLPMSAQKHANLILNDVPLNQAQAEKMLVVLDYHAATKNHIYSSWGNEVGHKWIRAITKDL